MIYSQNVHYLASMATIKPLRKKSNVSPIKAPTIHPYACADCHLTFPNESLRRSHCFRLIHSPPPTIIAPLTGARLERWKARKVEANLCSKMRNVRISKSSPPPPSEKKIAKKEWPCFCGRKFNTLKAGVDHLRTDHRLAIKGDELPAEALYVPVKKQLSVAYHALKAEEHRSYRKMLEGMAKVALTTPPATKELTVMPHPDASSWHSPKRPGGYEFRIYEDNPDIYYKPTTVTEEAGKMDVDDWDWTDYNFQSRQWEIPELR